MKLKLLTFLVFGGVSQASAVTLINNVEIVPYTDFLSPPGSYALGYHGFPEALFSPNPGSGYLLSYLGIAEEFAFYNVSVGDLFDPTFKEQAPRLISNTGNPGSATFEIAVNESRYLGYWANYIDYYGWVRITRTPAGLVASESATSVGNGIRVGSYVEIPEPSVTLLGLLAMAPLFRRSRTFNSKRPFGRVRGGLDEQAARLAGGAQQRRKENERAEHNGSCHTARAHAIV